MSFLQKNLAALAPHFPNLAVLIPSSPIPDGYTPAAGTDGTPTYARTSTSPDGKKTIHWLGNTSMPAASALPIIKSLDPFSSGQSGLALSVGTGFEWAAFIQRLPRAQLLYLYEPNLSLRMALDICDLADHLAGRRLILLAGTPEAAAHQLSAFLAANIGFDPPAVLHPLPTLIGDRRNQLLSAGEAIVRRAITERHTLLAQLHESLTSTHNSRLKTQDALLAFLLTPRYALERPIQHEARRLAATILTIDRHDSASLAIRLKLLADHRPHRILSDLFRTQLTAIPPEIPVETWIPPLIGPGYWERLPPPAALAPADRIIVHSSHHAQQLKDRGISTQHIEIRQLEIPLSPHSSKFSEPVSAFSIQHSAFAPRIALLADLPPSDAASLGIQLPTHLAVFAAARELIIADYLTVHPAMASDILRRALARAGVSVDDPALKDPMRRVIRDVLIPALPLLTLAAALAKENLPLTLIGDWPNLQLPAQSNIQPVAFDQLSENSWQSVGLLVHFSPQGNFSPILFQAIAAGIPLITPVHPAPDTRAFPAQLAPDKDFAHPTPQNFLANLKTLIRDSTRRQQLATAARQKIMAVQN